MRAEIDKNDVAKAMAEAEPRAARWRHLSTLAACGAFALAGGPVTYIGRGESLVVAAGMALALAAILVAGLSVRARKRAAAARCAEAVKDRLTVGRFDYAFTNDHLAIKGALGLRKISWSAVRSVENAKSSLLFRLEDGGFEFLPKNVLAEAGLFAKVAEKHAAARVRGVAFEEALHAAPLSVTYEHAPSDDDEYRMWRLKRRDGWMHPLRRLARWRPLAPIAFALAVLVAIGAAALAYARADLLFAAAAMVSAFIAAAIFVLGADYFRGPAHPFRKPRGWPYAQTNLTSVTLSREAVCRRRRGEVEMLRWAAIERFIERPMTAYLVIAPGRAIALPKRAFLQARHYRAFASFAKRAIAEAARGKETAKRRRLVHSLAKPQPVAGVLPPPPKRRALAAAEAIRAAG